MRWFKRAVFQKADAAGMSEDELLAEVLDHQHLRELMIQSVDAAAGAHDEWKVDVLARAFARGAMDEAIVDEMLLAVSVLRRLEVAHARLMRTLYPS